MSSKAKPHRNHETLLAWAGLYGIWVILSGKFDVFHLGLGLATVFLLAWLHRGLEPFRRPGDPSIRASRLAPYIVWLSFEMFLSAVHVAKVILRPRGQLAPRLIHFECEQPSKLNAVIFAHSITLTPGTITLDLDDGRYLVHALTPHTADGLIRGQMARRVARLATDEPIAPPRLLDPPSP